MGNTSLATHPLKHWFRPSLWTFAPFSSLTAQRFWACARGEPYNSPIPRYLPPLCFFLPKNPPFNKQDSSDPGKWRNCPLWTLFQHHRGGWSLPVRSVYTIHLFPLKCVQCALQAGKGNNMLHLPLAEPERNVFIRVCAYVLIEWGTVGKL